MLFVRFFNTIIDRPELNVERAGAALPNRYRSNEEAIGKLHSRFQISESSFPTRNLAELSATSLESLMAMTISVSCNSHSRKETQIKSMAGYDLVFKVGFCAGVL